MTKTIIIVLLLIAVILEGAFIANQKPAPQTKATLSQATVRPTQPLAGPNAKRGPRQAPIIMSKGANLKSSPLFAYAFQIAPGNLSDKAKQALTGWNIASKTQSDGSVTVTLTPKDSEDQNQQYIVKKGQTLYFIEQTPSDDKSDSDKDLNYRDDYGIITDSNGIVQ